MNPIQQQKYKELILQLAQAAIDCETDKLYNQQQAIYKAMAALEDL